MAMAMAAHATIPAGRYTRRERLSWVDSGLSLRRECQICSTRLSLGATLAHDCTLPGVEISCRQHICSQRDVCN